MSTYVWIQVWVGVHLSKDVEESEWLERETEKIRERQRKVPALASCFHTIAVLSAPQDTMCADEEELEKMRYQMRVRVRDTRKETNMRVTRERRAKRSSM
jgi:hypothetical protein